MKWPNLANYTKPPGNGATIEFDRLGEKRCKINDDNLGLIRFLLYSQSIYISLPTGHISTNQAQNEEPK